MTLTEGKWNTSIYFGKNASKYSRYYMRKQYHQLWDLVLKIGKIAFLLVWPPVKYHGMFLQNRFQLLSICNNNETMLLVLC